MTMKIQWWLMMFVTVWVFSACDDNDDDVKNVPNPVAQALKAKYPSVAYVEWERKGDYYVAECALNGQDMDVWFDNQGEWRLTETEIYWNSLPTAVQTAFSNGEYAAWKLEDMDMLEFPSLPTEYVIEVEMGRSEYQLFYSESGDLLQKKDVSNKDDTHWPR